MCTLTLTACLGCPVPRDNPPVAIDGVVKLQLAHFIFPFIIEQQMLPPCLEPLNLCLTTARKRSRLLFIMVSACWFQMGLGCGRGRRAAFSLGTRRSPFGLQLIVLQEDQPICLVIPKYKSTSPNPSKICFLQRTEPSYAHLVGRMLTMTCAIRSILWESPDHNLGGFISE